MLLVADFNSALFGFNNSTISMKATDEQHIQIQPILRDAATSCMI